MRPTIVHLQLGKNSLTPGFLELVSKTFKKHDLVKITILKSCCRDRKEAKIIAETLCNELKKIHKKKFIYKLIGYTINIKKWRRKT